MSEPVTWHYTLELLGGLVKETGSETLTATAMHITALPAQHKDPGDVAVLHAYAGAIHAFGQGVACRARSAVQVFWQ